jgi:hypothetical protein
MACPVLRDRRCRERALIRGGCSQELHGAADDRLLRKQRLEDPVGRGRRDLPEQRVVLELLPGLLSEQTGAMFSTAFQPRCDECGADLNALRPSFCLLCARLFCSRHLLIANSIATCHGCQNERKRRETEGVIDDTQFQRIVSLLRADLLATAVDCDAIVLEEATRLRLFAGSTDAYDDEVVGQVQQRLHDEFIDTTWPACPQHPNHPLWMSDGWWRCPSSGTAVAPLGQLMRGRFRTP